MLFLDQFVLRVHRSKYIPDIYRTFYFIKLHICITNSDICRVPVQDIKRDLERSQAQIHVLREMSEFLLVALTSEEAVNVRDKLNIISTQFRSLMKICVTYMTRLEGITSPGGLSSDQVSQPWLSLVREKSGNFVLGQGNLRF